MTDLPTRLGCDSTIRHLKERGNKSAAAVIEAWASGRLFDREAMTSMYRQGGLSGAWYPIGDLGGEPVEPDGWLAIGGVE